MALKREKKQIDDRLSEDLLMRDCGSTWNRERGRGIHQQREMQRRNVLQLDRRETLTFHSTNTRMRLRNIQVESKESNESSPCKPPDDCEIYELPPQR